MASLDGAEEQGRGSLTRAPSSQEGVGQAEAEEDRGNVGRHDWEENAVGAVELGLSAPVRGHNLGNC